MTGPRTREPQAEEQRRPAEITIPRLSPEETARRAGTGYDAAVSAVIRQHFNAAPPPAEINAVRSMVNERARGGQDVDLAAVLDDYVSQNPNSLIARYYHAAGGATDWLLVRGQVGFNRTAFQANIRSSLQAGRQPFVNALVELNNPRNRSTSIDVSQLAGLMPAAVRDMSGQLVAQFERGRNQLPVTIAYNSDDQRLMLTTKLPPPPQEVDFGRSG